MLKHPLSIDFSWQKDPQGLEVPSNISKSLLDTGSLTALLKQACQEFRVQVLNEELIETSTLTGEQQGYLCREVLLRCDGRVKVYAQSWISMSACQLGVEKLGETPLGEVLFQSSRWHPSNIEIAKVTDALPLAKLVNSPKLVTCDVFARRRTFTSEQAHIMVCEVFLPEEIHAI